MEHRTCPTDKELIDIIDTLTLHEKSILCSGLDAWRTKAIPQKGVPALRMADGPHGVRVEDARHKKETGEASMPSTCFPPEVALACSWDPGLVQQVGDAIAEECLHYGVGLLLGPGVNIKRSPLCGRNFEYYSEDPRLSGELATGFIAGVQGKGVGTSLKHYAVNNQEKLRMSINAAVDDRALFDIYLKAFEIAIKKAKPASIMASYNRVNGAFATENKRLLTDILRLKFGFAGAVISDWGAVNDRPAGVAAGLDLEMPASGGMNDWAVEQAVKSGFVTEDALDVACLNLLRLVHTHTREGLPAPACDWDAHHALAADALCKSAVLLKNDGMLPLGDEGRIAVIGQMAETPRFQGGGSSVINPTHVTSFLAAMKTAGKKFVYAPGYADTQTSEKMIAAAVTAAKTARTTVLFLGLPDAYECEGMDRTHLRLPQSQLRLLAAVADASKNLCVVLCCGAPVETPWLDDVNALLCLHVGGQAMGAAAVRLLYGQANPSGKLAETWPRKLEDTPTYHHFPMGPNEVTYNESIFVGYRYYDAAKKALQFPFGYGLSYTSYAYTGLSVLPKTLKKGGSLKIKCRVKNTGAVSGEEIVQVYFSRKQSATFQPVRELLCFGRVALAAGQEKELTFTVPYAELAFHDVHSGTDVVEGGIYEISAGPGSRDLPLTAGFGVEGVSLPKDEAALAHYGHLADNAFPHEGFAALYKGKLQGNAAPKKGTYTNVTPLAQMQDSLPARCVLRLARFVSKRVIHFSPNTEANAKAARQMAEDLPFKNLSLNTSGYLSPRAAEALLALCNGRGGFGSFVRQLFIRPPYRR